MRPKSIPAYEQERLKKREALEAEKREYEEKDRQLLEQQSAPPAAVPSNEPH